MADVTPPPLPPSATPLPTTPPLPPQTSVAAIASLVLALLSFTCGWLFTAIPAVICGHVARSRIRRSGGAIRGKGIATAGLIIGYIAVVIGSAGIPLLIGVVKSSRQRVHALQIERKQVVSADGLIALSVPGTWVETPGLNKSAVLQVGSKGEDCYAIVIADLKTQVPDMTLEKHHQLTREHMLPKMDDSSAGATVPLTIDGKSSFQDELRGKQKGYEVVFLHTTIDDGDRFQQILAWTTKSHWSERNAVLREVTNSFHRLK